MQVLPHMREEQSRSHSTRKTGSLATVGVGTAFLADG
jgi:hypothetical protein